MKEYEPQSCVFEEDWQPDIAKDWQLAVKQRQTRKKEKVVRASQEVRDEHTRHYCTFYRRNINLYVTERLGVKLYPFQHVMLYLASRSQVFWSICSRGISKTFIIGLFAIAKAMLYPYSEIVITSSTLTQAMKMVEDKMEREIVKKLSPLLKYLYDQKQIVFSYGQYAAAVEFKFNGSRITVVPFGDSARGGRMTMGIYDEVRLLKKGVLDAVFEKMAHPRQAQFLQLEDYKDNPLYLEDAQSFYITSARYKTEWFWNSFKQAVQACYNNRIVKYDFFAGDIYIALEHGLKTIADYYKALGDGADYNFRMEDLNEMLGETEDAYFSLELLRQNQTSKKVFLPPTVDEYNEGRIIPFPDLAPNEYRIIGVDLAFASTTNNRSENDNTVIICVSVKYTGGRCLRRLDYIETRNGSDSKGTQLRIHELFWDYHANYIVLDLKSGGEVYYNDLTAELAHPERDNEDWNPHGFCLCNDSALQTLSKVKQDDLMQRVVDPQAIPCIVPISAVEETNSLMWQDLHKSFRDGLMQLPIDETEYKSSIEGDKEYMMLTSAEKARRDLPFVQANFLVYEAINLSAEWRMGRLRLSEPRTGTKDRIVILSYVNYVATLIQNKLSIDENQEDYDFSDYQLIF